MLKTLAAQIKQYKRSTLLTPLFTVLEVVMEVLIPVQGKPDRPSERGADAVSRRGSE